jgi:hypothetical protein
MLIASASSQWNEPSWVPMVTAAFSIGNMLVTEDAPISIILFEAKLAIAVRSFLVACIQNK